MTKGFLCVLDALRLAEALAEVPEVYLNEASAAFRKAGIRYDGDRELARRRQIVAELRPRSFPLFLPQTDRPGGRFEIRIEGNRVIVVEAVLPLHLWKRVLAGQRFAFSVDEEPYMRFSTPYAYDPGPYDDQRTVDPATRKWAWNTVGWCFTGGLGGHLWIGKDLTEYWSGRPLDALVERFDGLPLDHP